MKAGFFIGLCLLISVSCFSQSYIDILRYSQKNQENTARGTGVSHALGAVGGDFSAIDINPASLGIYRRNEFSGSFDFNTQRSSSMYIGNAEPADKSQLNISQLGFVITNLKYKDNKPVKEGWVSVNWAIGYNRTNNFYSETAISGVNTSSSILHNWRQNIQGIPANQMNKLSYGYLGIQSALIYADDNNPKPYQYYDITEAETDSILHLRQEDFISTTGNMKDYSASVAGNYNNKLFIGASLLVPTLRYVYTREFTETNLNSSPKYYNGMSLIENVKTSGIGISAAFGAIYRPNDILRVGASFQLPTYYSMNDNFSYTVSSMLTNGGRVYPSDPGQFSYSLSTPVRSTLSAAAIIEKSGFLSFDLENVNYSTGRLTYEGSRPENEKVSVLGSSAWNARLGGEYKYEKFAFRAGFQYLGGVYKSTYTPKGFDGSGYGYSLGTGYRDSDFFIDLGLQTIYSGYYYIPYTLKSGKVEGANINTHRTSVIFTFGSRF